MLLELRVKELTTAVEESVAALMAPKNQALRERVAVKGAAVSHEQLNFCFKMLFDLVESAYMRHFLADVRHTFKREGDAVPSCLKGRSVASMKPIGEGADGAVFQLSDNTVVKIGDINTHRDRPIPDVFYEMALREVEIARAAGKAGLAPKVLDAYYCCSPSACKYVIHMTKVNGTSLHTWNLSASERERVAMSKKLMAQLRKLHRLGIAHSDLHDENIMVDGNKPVIIDFSRSVWMNEKQGKYDIMQVQGFFEKLPTKVDDLVTLVVFDLISKKLMSVR
jgi:tRNA A-37 threonylcarbamoyl transferase component Bud32